MVRGEEGFGDRQVKLQALPLGEARVSDIAKRLVPQSPPGPPFGRAGCAFVADHNLRVLEQVQLVDVAWGHQLRLLQIEPVGVCREAPRQLSLGRGQAVETRSDDGLDGG
ncbi:MAG: hypothetical protein M3R54_09710, partial [Chloroflexota bacterium]|nr:hypothetical protein [Chloroflexota bacterium]